MVTAVLIRSSPPPPFVFLASVVSLGTGQVSSLTSLRKMAFYKDTWESHAELSWGWGPSGFFSPLCPWLLHPLLSLPLPLLLPSP